MLHLRPLRSALAPISCARFAASAGGSSIMAMIWSAPAVIPPAMSPALNRGRMLLRMMTLGHRVGQEDARAIAGFDPHLPFVGRNQQDDAVILLLVADPPLAAQTVAIILDRPPFEALDRCDDELPPGSLSSASDLDDSRPLARD